MTPKEFLRSGKASDFHLGLQPEAWEVLCTWMEEYADYVSEETQEQKEDKITGNINSFPPQAYIDFTHEHYHGEPKLISDDKITEWVCKEFNVDGLDFDEDFTTQYGYLPEYFKKFANDFGMKILDGNDTNVATIGETPEQKAKRNR